MDEKIIKSETLKKITGNIPEEATEATYRLAAILFVQEVRQRTVDLLDTNPNSGLVSFLKTNTGMSNAVLAFLLAASLELAPTAALTDVRERIAFNLRVQSYVELEGLLIRPILDSLDAAFKIAMIKARNLGEELPGRNFASTTA